MLKLLFALLNFGKLLPLLKSGGTMLLMMLSYTLLFGWRYAVGFVLLILLHELGHFFAARRIGLDAGLPMFIPFIGAWTTIEGQILNAADHAYIALAGPVAGTLASLLCYYVAREQDSSLLLALSYSGFMLNLLNLLPISALDGGHVVAVLSPRIWLVGAPMLGALFFWTQSPIILLIAFMALPGTIAAWRGTWRENLPADYFEQPLEVKLKYGAGYFGLMIFLALMSTDVHEMLAHVRAGT
jgi:Zn-dependent protease